MDVDPLVFIAHVLRVAIEYQNWSDAERMLYAGVKDTELLARALEELKINQRSAD